MTFRNLTLSVAVSLVALANTSPAAFAERCEDLAKLHLSHVTMTKVEPIVSGVFIAGTVSLAELPEFCRVTATISTVPKSQVRVEIWLPRSQWNGRLEGVGNGGFAGSISYESLASGLRLGYATVSTDMGMAVPPGADPSVVLNEPERWTDWGYRATHEMTVLAKQIVKTYYDRPVIHAYFVGCSTGGQQALGEAQRFPDDYDGIVGGAPAHNRTGVHISILWNFADLESNPDSYLPPAKTEMLSRAVVNSCDALDGVKDGVIADPRSCKFDPATLECKGESQDSCLTKPQVEAAKKLYSGPVNPHTGVSLYPGLERGSEFAWDRIGPAPTASMAAPYHLIFEWVYGQKWDWRSFDYDSQVIPYEKKLATTLNATNPDLDTFRSHGHKLLLYHGWGDWLVPPLETVNYYDSIVARDGIRAGAAATALNTSVRLFMVPGMGHCGGGPGPTHFDSLSAVVKWVEQGIAPERLIASQLKSEAKGETTVMQRPLCPFPHVAKYSGKGNTNDAASYVCMNPTP